MTTDEVRRAFADFRILCDTIPVMANSFTRLLAGHLRDFEVYASYLDALKHELRDWDMAKHQWRQRKG